MEYQYSVRQRWSWIVVWLSVLLLTGCLGGSGGGSGSDGGSDGGSGNDGGSNANRDVSGDQGSGGSVDPLAASKYRSAYIIGDTKKDGSPIASNHPEGFNNPTDITVSRDHFYVADRSNNRISKFKLDGTFVDNWKIRPNSSTDREPTGVAVSPSGVLHVSGYTNNNIYQYSLDGTELPASLYGPGGSQSLYRVAVGPDHAYVADSQDHRILRAKPGKSANASLGGAESAWRTDNSSLEFAAAAGSREGYFNDPRGVAVDAERGFLYVADTKNNRIQQFDLDSGKVVGVWGEKASSEPPNFAWPSDVAVDANGNVYAVDIRDRIYKFTRDGTRVASFGASGSGQGEMRVPVGIAVDDSGNLYVAEDTPNHRVQKFAPVSGSEAAIAGDSSGKAGPGALATIGAESAEDAGVSVLQSQGLAPQSEGVVATLAASGQPGVRDYVDTEVDDNGYRRIKLWIGPDGNIIPTGEWRDANSGYCSGANEAMKGAVRLLNIKVYPVADSYFAFAQYIDVGTGKILEQREGQSSDLQDAVNQAWNRLGTPIGETTSPCRELARDFRFRFKTELTEKITSSGLGVVTTYTHAVTASGPLDYKESNGRFVGSATLNWHKHDASTTDSRFPYVDCPAPETGTVKIIYNAGPEGKPGDMVDATVEFLNVGQPECLQQDTAGGDPFEDPLFDEFPFYWKKYHSDEYSKSTGTFTIDGWQAVPSAESIVAEKFYDLTDSGSNENGSIAYEETSSIRIMK